VIFESLFFLLVKQCYAISRGLRYSHLRYLEGGGNRLAKGIRGKGGTTTGRGGM
jgi:hypothetical protein